MEKRIVTAPKDPVEKRECIYIFKDIQIEATLRDNGVCSQETYLDGGRMIQFAKYNGEVQDEEILRLLETTKGFVKLVHSVGISIVAKDSSEKIETVLKSYGRRDRFGGGTALKAVIPGNGEEQIIPVANQGWTNEDDVIGMISFVFGKAGDIASATLIFYLNEGFKGPVLSEEKEIDTESEAYRSLVKESLISKGSTERFRAAAEKLMQGGEITMAFIGGSITQGAGAKPISSKCYAFQLYERFADWMEMLMREKSLPDAEEVRKRIHYRKAGIGGTDSELGMMRYERDICLNGKSEPDILVIEFAVNDMSDELEGGCYESLVRKALNGAGHPAVFLLFSVFQNDWNLQERLIPIGENYGLPMVSLANAVVEQFYEREKRVISKRQYFYDMFHPSNTGHRLMADCLLHCMMEMYMDNGTEETGDAGFNTEFNMELKKPVYSSIFENVRLVDKKEGMEGFEILQGSFTETDEELQCVERDKDCHQTRTFPYNWKKPFGSKNRALCVKVNCKAFLVIGKDSGDVQTGTAEFYADGEKMAELNPHINNWTHCNARILFMEEESAEHSIEIKMKEQDAGKSFTVLGFGVVK